MYVGSGEARPKMRFKMMSAVVAHIAGQLKSSGVRVHELSKRPDITQVPQPSRNSNAVTTARSRGTNAFFFFKQKTAYEISYAGQPVSGKTAKGIYLSA